MKKKDKAELEKLTNETVKLLSSLNALEKTFSRIKNEGEELLRKLLKANDEVNEDVKPPKFDEG